jgi:glucosylceramidase
VLADPQAARYVSGIAWHCYAGKSSVQAALHDKFPAKDTWFTECSGGRWSPDWAKNLQYFTRTLVIDTTRGWARGVLFWNLALDENDGPHLGGCKDCRGVVTIDSKDRRRHPQRRVLRAGPRQPLRAAGRAPHRLERGTAEGLANVAFRNPDGAIALLVANGAAAARTSRSRWASSPSATRCRRPASPRFPGNNRTEAA